MFEVFLMTYDYNYNTNDSVLILKSIIEVCKKNKRTV